MILHLGNKMSIISDLYHKQCNYTNFTLSRLILMFQFYCCSCCSWITKGDICNKFTQKHTRTHTHSHKHTCTRAHICTFVQTRIGKLLHAHTHTCTSTHTNRHTCTHILNYTSNMAKMYPFLSLDSRLEFMESLIVRHPSAVASNQGSHGP